jgi:hypothetical protein
MLIYSRAVPEEDLGLLPWPEDVVVRVQLRSLPLSCARAHTHLQREVERHNQLFLESVDPQAVAQTIQDDIPVASEAQVSVPSSTSVSGFNTPLEAPITPGEHMDLGN